MVVQYVVETSNMGCTADAMTYLIGEKVPFAPGKAANAGGVAVSGLEMSQNSMKLSWDEAEGRCEASRYYAEYSHILRHLRNTGPGYINYVKGANIAGFKKVADAMLDFGY